MNSEVQPPSIEALIQQLLDTFGDLWKRIRSVDADEEVAADVVVLGAVFPNAKLLSPDIATAISTRFWFTYRAGFEPIERAENGPGPLTFARSMIFNASPNNTIGGLLNNQTFLTDVGWGCMIRTSQSLLANALRRVVLDEAAESVPLEKLRYILGLFGDNYKSPFSLHNFIQAASRLPLQVKPGEWFGPSAASLSIKRLSDALEASSVAKLNVYIGESGGLSDEDIEGEFATSEAPLLVLLPVRLGITNINEIYHGSLLQLLALKQSVGIAGGKPSSSYYFFGYQNDNLLYLDPHHLQPVSEDYETYHTSRCLTLPISQLDPSMLIGLLFENVGDYHAFKAEVHNSNKIVQFHDHTQRKRSFVERGEDYVKVIRERDTVDDFVDVGDDFSDDDIVNCAVSSASESTPSPELDLSASDTNYDMVEIPSPP